MNNNVIDITWLDGIPHRIVDSEIVSYPMETEVVRAGKKVVQITRAEFTIATARPASAAEVLEWEAQP